MGNLDRSHGATYTMNQANRQPRKPKNVQHGILVVPGNAPVGFKIVRSGFTEEPPAVCKVLACELPSILKRGTIFRGILVL